MNRTITAFGVLFLPNGCGTAPIGPTVSIMPGKGKSTEVFTANNAICKQFADNKLDDDADRANVIHAIEGFGAPLLGAGIGAAFGGARGAKIGAALGAVGGVGAGIYISGKAQTSLQDWYNPAFVECTQTRKNWLPATSAGR